MDDDRLISAARAVLDGDDSRVAASALEAVIVDNYLDDERFEELLETLALYQPGAGSPYSNYEDLQRATRDVLGRLA